SAPSASQVPTGPEVNTGGENFKIKTVSLRWCRPTHFVVGPMRMPALISSSSWSSAVLLLSRVYREMQSGSVCFRFLSRGERINGFMLTRLLWILGTNVPRHSSQISSRRAKPMLFVVGFRTSSSHQTSQFRRLQEYILACPHHAIDNWLIL